MVRGAPFLLSELQLQGDIRGQRSFREADHMQIRVSNNGPNDATDATLTDLVDIGNLRAGGGADINVLVPPCSSCAGIPFGFGDSGFCSAL